MKHEVPVQVLVLDLALDLLLGCPPLRPEGLGPAKQKLVGITPVLLYGDHLTVAVEDGPLVRLHGPLGDSRLDSAQRLGLGVLDLLCELWVSLHQVEERPVARPLRLLATVAVGRGESRGRLDAAGLPEDLQEALAPPWVNGPMCHWDASC